jgi:iron complex transport system ATP-binding protein
MVKIEVKDLSFRYNSNPILNNLKFLVEKGSFVGIVGPNGAGKTTLLRCISRLLEPSANSVFLGDVDIQRIPLSDLAKKVSVILTSPIETPQMRVSEIMAASRYPYTGLMGFLKQNDFDKMNEALSMLNLTELVDRFFYQLSDGQKQKVLVARALAQEPEVLLIDEPTSHLDVKHQIEVMQLFRERARDGLTVLSAIHYVTLASSFCDCIILMKDGRILDLGNPKNVLNSLNIAKAYSLDRVVVVDILGQHLIPITRKINHEKSKRVHVVCGGSTGLEVFKVLRDLPVNITSGIIHKSDLDYYASEAISTSTVCEKAYTPISEQKYEIAQKLIERSDVIIDTGFPIGPINKLNSDLILNAVNRGKRVISLRKPSEDLKHNRSSGKEKIHFIESPTELNKILRTF